jgi:hypothetical protein
MKKAIKVLGILFLLTSLTACSKSGKESPLYKKGVEMTKQLNNVAKDEDYKQIFSMSPEINKIADNIRDEDFTNPKAVYEITGLDSISLESLKPSTAADKVIENTLASGIVYHLNSASGSEALVISSFINVIDILEYKGMDQTKAYLYLYSGDYNSLVVFSPYADYVVNAYAGVIINPDLSANSTEDDVKGLIEDSLGDSSLTVKLVK